MKKINLILLLVVLASCGLSKDAGKLIFNDGVVAKKDTIEVPVDKDPQYTKLSKDIFEKSCTGCHNPKKPRRLDLTSKENIIREYDDILYRMTDAFNDGVDNMPPKGDKVSDELIIEFKKWKEQLPST